MFEGRYHFYSLLEEHYKEQPNKRPYSKDKQEAVVNEIQEAKLKKHRKTRREYYLLKAYDVFSVGTNKNYLIKKCNTEPNTKDQVKYVVAYEDLFDRLKECHTRTNHGGSVKMRKDLKTKFCVPRPAIDTYLKVCPKCSQKKSASTNIVVRPISPKDFNDCGQVDIIDHQSMPDGDYKLILKYQDHSTKFLCLRPLKTATPEEVAHELLKIFLTSGAPQILQSDNGREFVNEIIRELEKMWPDCVIVNGHEHCQGSIAQSNQDIEDMLWTWMTDNKCKNWSTGLNFVQWQKNTSFHEIIGRSPYNAVFGVNPKVGLSSSYIPQSMLNVVLKE